MGEFFIDFGKIRSRGGSGIGEGGEEVEDWDESDRWSFIGRVVGIISFFFFLISMRGI